ncbi:pirin family protein [Paenactinomyces guangxiensis]|uniref:Pirin family protein n=1 Tax=Paenactinomyces guangxiensis TaxID=1490290 RepID=A0A7W2A6U9_9BACL|nr:pirin family protein [Paenactinomyces guangxiensis]MBA4492905.1 pirin family protein [Paenactinomyces guangxiensis]MBH8590246.1 pirin family protein [Paenactinomyces guangxiensis]
MIQIIPSEQRYKAEHGWLTSYHSFSFADYYDPDNLQFGSLRVFNDDIIQGGQGFGMHPHANMEIMTYVIDGTLEHQDSLGNKGLIEAGEVQRMTAGTGIYHSEYNHSPEKPVHLLQIWFIPNQKDLSPSWEQRKFSREQQLNQLLPVVSGRSLEHALTIHQDVTVYLSHLQAGKELVHRQQEHRRMYLFVIEGKVALNETHTLSAGDTARISGLSELHLATHRGGEFMLMDLA